VDCVEGLSPDGAACLLLDTGAYGMLRVEDAERLQVMARPGFRPSHGRSRRRCRAARGA
jgi:hypothetical protein